MKNNYKNAIKWFVFTILTMPVFAYGQAVSMSSQNKAVELTAIDRSSNVEPEVQNPLNINDDAQWIHYDDFDLFDSWGFLIQGEEYDIVAKWDPADLTDYGGWVITKIKFIVVSNLPYIKVKVWEGTNFTEIYSQDVPTYNVNTWTEVTLDTPVEIDINQELYVGYYVDMLHTELGGFVTATDDGPAIDNYGNLCRFNGSWYSDFYNHNLQVYIEPNLNADFEADATTVCYGSTVNFTSLATAEETYNWTFEGGTPATSTDQNPSVVYDTPGTYDVTLEVTRDNGNESDTETKSDYISVLEIPAQADQPSGDTETCTSTNYNYETNDVLYSTDYEWEVSPTDAGTLTWENNVALLETDGTWTGDYTISVRATNMCGDGDWSDEIECTLNVSPAEFTIEGGGGYCLGDDGAEITLDGSQTGVDYELYLDGITTGVIVSGTDTEISFGLFTEEGYYEVVGSNDNCTYPMSGQVQVFVEYPPLEPATPQGPTSICEETSSEYTTDEQDDADSFVWLISPAEAGTITGAGDEATVEWDQEFLGLAYISVYGVNECGDGNPSGELEVSVGTPNPEIVGEDLVCDWSDEIYEVTENEGSTYTWTVTEGEITEGQGTYMVTISWYGEGSGTIQVEEETANGCSGESQEFEVLIDDCTAIEENMNNYQLSLFPNPADNYLYVNGQIDGSINIEVINITGQLVMKKTINEKNSKIDIATLDKGIYFIKVLNSSENWNVTRFIKK